MLIRIWASIAKQGGGSSDTLPLGPLQCLPVVSRGKGTQREAAPRLEDTKVIYLFQLSMKHSLSSFHPHTWSQF